MSAFALIMGKHPENSVDEEDDDALDETEFIVEKILDRKVVNGEVYYFLKWKGFDDTENTWVEKSYLKKKHSYSLKFVFLFKEPEMNLDCPELIADFQKRASAQLKKPSNEPAVENNPTNNTTANKRSARDSVDQQQESSDAAKKSKRANDFGYGRGLEIEKILGATDVYGELMFL